MASVWDYYFIEVADPRVYNWPLMSSPWIVLGILFVYLYLIYRCLPSYMSNRNPFSLKWFLAIYNIAQIIACSLLIRGLLASGWGTHYKLIGCQSVDFSENPMAVRMVGLIWWATIIRIMELLETIMFSLRKKVNQVSALHVFHHVSMVMIGWLVCKYYGGGMITFRY